MNNDRFRQAQEYQRQKIKDAGYGGIDDHTFGMALGAGATGVVGGAIDLGVGEANAFNSGEFGANMALGTLPIFGGVVGGMAGASMTPDKQTGLKSVKEKAKEEAMKAQKSGNDPNAGANRYAEYMKEGNARYEPISPKTDLTVAQVMNARRGMAIGAAAMLVPALLGMRDQQKLAQQSAELM